MGRRDRKKKIKEIRVHGDVSGSKTITIAINTDNFYVGDHVRKEIIDDNLYTDFTTLATVDNTDDNESNDRYGVSVDTEFYVAQFKITMTAGATVSEIEIL